MSVDESRVRRSRSGGGLLSGEAESRRVAAELMTRHALEVLPASDWSIVGDLQWRGGKYGDVDHVVIGPSGIYLLDTMPWSGPISTHDGHLRHDGRVEDAAVKQLNDAAAAVALLVQGVPRELIKPVIVVGAATDPVNEKIGGVRIVDAGSLARTLEASAHTMSNHQVARTTAQLTDYLHDDRVVKVAAKAGRAERRKAARTPRRRRRIPVIRLAIAAWFLATLILAPQVFADGYAELQEFIGRQMNRF